MTRPLEKDGYQGPASVRVGAGAFEVEADLRGRFEPLDGRYHWYGRLGRNDALTAALAGGGAKGTLSTALGTADCELSDLDPWLRYRVSGISTPPFAHGSAREAG
jgi:Domain of unknown function (DUF4873)